MEDEEQRHMNEVNRLTHNQIEKIDTNSSPYSGILLDLVIYISIMFLIREVVIPPLGFLANGVFWSLTTLVVASWRMRVRGVTWAQLGLVKPKHPGRTLLHSVIILVAVIVSIILFEAIKDQFPNALVADSAPESVDSKFGDLKGNWGQLLQILPLIWLESMLEELLDRGFLMTWVERLFSFTSAATIIAVVVQAALFGFRHSNDLSERSITVGLIGLIMGIAYVKFGRNLWPLIIAHCILNSMSMIERVLS